MKISTNFANTLAKIRKRLYNTKKRDKKREILQNKEGF